MHQPPADRLGMLQPHLCRHVQRRRFDNRRRLGDKEGHTHDAVSGPFDLWPQQTDGLFGQRRFQARVDIVHLVQFANILDLRRITKRTTAVRRTGLAVGVVKDIVAKVAAHRGAIIGFAPDERIGGDAAVCGTHNAIAVALWKVPRIDELSLGDGGKIPASVQHFFQKER
jgi:hypothetical protein